MWRRLKQSWSDALGFCSRVSQLVNDLRVLVNVLTEYMNRQPHMEVFQMPSLAYVAIEVTLAAGNHVYQLLQLLQAIEPNCPGATREMILQADTTNVATVLVGDAKISTSRFGYQLWPRESRTYRAEYQGVLLGNIFVMSTSDNQKLSVELMVI